MDVFNTISQSCPERSCRKRHKNSIAVTILHYHACYHVHWIWTVWCTSYRGLYQVTAYSRHWQRSVLPPVEDWRNHFLVVWPRWRIAQSSWNVIRRCCWCKWMYVFMHLVSTTYTSESWGSGIAVVAPKALRDYWDNLPLPKQQIAQNSTSSSPETLKGEWIGTNERNSRWLTASVYLHSCSYSCLHAAHVFRL